LQREILKRSDVDCLFSDQCVSHLFAHDFHYCPKSTWFNAEIGVDQSNEIGVGQSGEIAMVQ
jgi:hypothetical protein